MEPTRTPPPSSPTLDPIPKPTPEPVRRESIASVSEVSIDSRVPIHRRRPYRSPSRLRVKALHSAPQLLEKVNTFDGVVEIPHPNGSNVYVTTYPFTARDLAKWTWLLAHGVEDVYLVEHTARGDGQFARRPERQGRGRDDAMYWDRNSDQLTSVYLSRALDQSVVSEAAASEDKVRWVVVTQDREKAAVKGSKLVVLESRRAAGIAMFYEALRGDSVVFVAAVVGWGGRVGVEGFKWVESLEAARGVREEGGVGVIC